MEGFPIDGLSQDTLLLEEMDKCKTLLFRYFRERDGRIVEALMRKVFSDAVIDIIKADPERFVKMIRATGIKIFIGEWMAWIVVGSYAENEAGVKVAELDWSETKIA